MFYRKSDASIKDYQIGEIIALEKCCAIMISTAGRIYSILPGWIDLITHGAKYPSFVRESRAFYRFNVDRRWKFVIIIKIGQNGQICLFMNW